MVLTQTDLPSLKFHSRGKVRDIYDLGDSLLFIATDRLSAFDVVLPTAIPDKGRVLTQMSLFWFDHFKQLVPNHVITDDDSCRWFCILKQLTNGFCATLLRLKPRKNRVKNLNAFVNPKILLVAVQVSSIRLSE